MAMFSIIKRGRQAAKAHREEQAKKEQEEAKKPPYKHVPKHAAIDAMSGGPSGWREHDRAKIVEQNRRRSAMTASSMSLSGTATPVSGGVPRVHSSLSHVSYPSAYASPIVQVPRAYSYSSMSPGWTPHERGMNYSPVDIGAISLKGKEVERRRDLSRTSRSSSRFSAGRSPLPPISATMMMYSAPSPGGSSSDSTSSQDDLEMKPVVRHSFASAPSASPEKAERPASDSGSIHRLHPGRSRRISDPNQAAAQSRSSLAPRTSSMAPGIPPVPALPPMQFGTAISTPDITSSTASSASSVTMVPVASSVSLVGQAITTPTTLKVEDFDAPQQAEVVTPLSSDEETAPVKNSAASSPTPPDSPTKKGRRISKMTRFTDLEPIKSNTIVTIEASPPSPKESLKEKRRPTATTTALPTDFDESVLPAPKEIVLPTAPAPAPARAKSGKLTKNPAGGAKLVKKNRWSLRSSKSTAVAV